MHVIEGNANVLTPGTYIVHQEDNVTHVRFFSFDKGTNAYLTELAGRGIFHVREVAA